MRRVKSNFLLIIFCFFTFIIGDLKSAPFQYVPQTLLQPNGDTLHCFASGDEFHNWLHDENNYTIVQHPETGYFVYAIKINDQLQGSGFVAGKTDPQKLGLERGVNISPEEVQRKREEFFAMPPERIYAAPTIGIINNIVVFIRFSDQSEFTDSVSFYDSLFNSSITNINSTYNYFYEVSYGKLSVYTSFYPITTSTTVVSVQDAFPRDYYLPYNVVTNPIGYTTDGSARRRAMLTNALNVIGIQVPTGLIIDSDGDGFIDNVSFLVKGGQGAWGSVLWPHHSVLTSQNIFINGKQVSHYNFHLEQFIKTQLQGNGVICHEFFHTLGAPDLYHYSLDGVHPVSLWDLMGNQIDPPQHMGAFMKYRYGKWIDTIPEITSSGTYYLKPLLSYSNNVYKIASQNSATEYFILEYRKFEGVFEGTFIPFMDFREGILIYRINTVRDGFGNRNGPPDEVYIYRPGDSYISVHNLYPYNANFSANDGRTEFNNFTDPNCFLSDGTLGDISIHDIGTVGDSIQFSINILEGWKSQTSGTNNTLNSIQFIDLLNGWCVGNNGTILQTTNGGENWNSQTSGTTMDLTYISFADLNLGCATGYSGFGEILRTTDGGNNWSIITGGPFENLYAIKLVNDTLGFAVGDEGLMKKSTDGGASWSSFWKLGVDFYSVDFANTDIGWVVGYDPMLSLGNICKTTNGGDDWAIQYGLDYYTLTSVSCIGTENIWVVGEFGTILYSNDGGSNWVSQTSSTTERLNSINMIDIYTGWIVGNNGLILKTTNGGTNWELQIGGSGNSLKSVNFIDDMNGWICGINGLILNTDDSGLPVELFSFAGKVKGNSVTLNWQTATELNNYGFEIERASIPLNIHSDVIPRGDNGWKKIGFIEGHGNSSSPKSYSYIDRNPVGGSKFLYRLKQIDTDGSFEYSEIVEVVLSPKMYELFQNYPNPFNPITTIKFSIVEQSDVVVSVFNILGEKVLTEKFIESNTGFHEYKFDAGQFSSGVYFYSIEIGNKFSDVKKMLLLK